VDIFLDGEYRSVCEKTTADFLKKGVVVIEDDRYKTTVTPE